MPARESAGRGVRVAVVVVWLVLTGLTLMLLAGHGPWAGHVILTVTRRHGLDSGDLPVMAAWLVGTIACWQIWRRV